MIFSTVAVGVADAERSERFYTQGLGFSVDSRPLPGLVYLASGSTRIALYGAGALAQYAGVEDKIESGPRPGVVLGLNVDSREEVDATFDRACAHAGQALRAPAPMDWGGYAGTLTDPDGQIWEIVWSDQAVAKS